MTFKEFIRANVELRREPARRLLWLAVALAIAVAILGLIGYQIDQGVINL